MNSLNKIADKYPTDKSDHGYLPFYQEYLPKDCRSLLEIGIAQGHSALMWQEFYGKDLDLHVLDLFLDPNHVSVQWCKRNFITPHQGDQSSLKILAEVKEEFQVIIDDGSHNAHHMLISFKHLFHNNLIPGGQYWIEDCHCNFQEFYWDGEVKSFEDTPVAMFRHFKETGEIVNPYFNEGESEIFKNLIDNVEILCNEKLLLITRK